MIVKSFEKCGISNALDISENGLEGGGEENEDCIIGIEIKTCMM